MNLIGTSSYRFGQTPTVKTTAKTGDDKKDEDKTEPATTPDPKPSTGGPPPPNRPVRPPRIPGGSGG